MTSERVYVAIDLETTGLSAQQDAIIEIGAVRFTCPPAGQGAIRVLDRFVTFVNPGRAIPLRIQQLTGISNADVAGAPPLAQVAPELLAFVGADTRYAVAHNAGFDGAFLLAGGIDFHRPMQDTFELATILLPGAPSYSLGELANMLDIALPDAHRALDDAEATAALFGLLLFQAALLPEGIRRVLLECGRDSAWEPLFLLNDVDMSALPPPIPEDAGSAVAPADDSFPIEDSGASGLAAFYEPGGRLEHVLGPTYEYRPGQADMSQQVMDALSRGDHLLVEAGTGTGKTLAYLLPSSLWTLEDNDRVVVATNTIALQDQILDKDMPLVGELLRSAGLPEPRLALLKGRSNYLCTRRLHTWYRDRRLSPLELRLLAKVLVWLPRTSTGDVSELFMPVGAEQSLWQHVNSDAASCLPHRCMARCTSDHDVLGAHYRDFFQEARQRAEEAHILVVNHALLLADLESGGRVLPPYDNIIVDEAHRLEEAATENLTFRADPETLVRRLSVLKPHGELFRQLADGCTQTGDSACRSQIAQISAVAGATESAIRAFAESFLHFAMSHEAVRSDTGYTQRIAIDSAFRAQPAWSEVEIEWDRVGASLEELLDLLQALVAQLVEKQWLNGEPFASYLAELSNVTGQIREIAGAMNQIVYGDGDVQSGRLVTWVEVDERAATATLVSAPMFVSDRIENELVHGKRSVVLTGATLRTGSGFGFIRDRLGLWDVPATTVESPFDYKTSTLLFMPSDMPDPRNSHYQHAVERAVVSAAIATGGSTVALFTSYAQLRTTADAIRGPLDQAGITVLQHGAGSRRRLLREYRQTERAVLLGTRSFWEGIDLPGDELRCLLIVRLPFAVPSDPLVAARTADLENSFRDYTLPDAILRFRQGFGRLIRRSTDRGVVVILDSRVWRMDYGRAFSESLPDCTERHAPLDTLQSEVRAWLYSRPGAA